MIFVVVSIVFTFFRLVNWVMDPDFVAKIGSKGLTRGERFGLTIGSIDLSYLM